MGSSLAGFWSSSTPHTGTSWRLVQAAILFITASFIFINLVVDLSYVYIDPRIKLK